MRNHPVRADRRKLFFHLAFLGEFTFKATILTNIFFLFAHLLHAPIIVNPEIVPGYITRFLEFLVLFLPFPLS
jgi:hypothetical protein